MSVNRKTERVEEITDEASSVHLYQLDVRIDVDRAGATESRFGNVFESDPRSDEHHVDCLQPDCERPDGIRARPYRNLDAPAAVRTDIVDLIVDELWYLDAEQQHLLTGVRGLFDDHIVGLDEHGDAGRRHGIRCADEQSGRTRVGNHECQSVWSQQFHDAVDRSDDADIPDDASRWYDVDGRSAAVSTLIRRPEAVASWHSIAPRSVLNQ